MQQLGMKILNDVVWEKPNLPKIYLVDVLHSKHSTQKPIQLLERIILASK